MNGRQRSPSHCRNSPQGMNEPSFSSLRLPNVYPMNTKSAKNNISQNRSKHKEILIKYQRQRLEYVPCSYPKALSTTSVKLTSFHATLVVRRLGHISDIYGYKRNRNSCNLLHMIMYRLLQIRSQRRNRCLPIHNSPNLNLQS